jgi:putative glutamine amidotransferase
MKRNFSEHKKPIIGISTNFSKIMDKPFNEYDKIFINSGYIDVIIQAGGVPLLLPMNADSKTTDQLLALVDGVLLSGGQDVHPSHYNEELHPLLGITAEQRDAHEMHIVKVAYAEKKPILGICRGLQLINVVFGGTLYQDLSQHGPDSKLGHSLDERTETTLHPIEVVPGTALHTIFGNSRVVTNSYHHQAIKKLAPGFTVSARAEDGVIEAVENISPDGWVIAVQWHPEMMVKEHPAMGKLFDAFIAQITKK